MIRLSLRNVQESFDAPKRICWRIHGSNEQLLKITKLKWQACGSHANSYKHLQTTINGLNRMTIGEKEKTSVTVQTVINLKDRIVSILKRSPEPAIALSAIFQATGFQGITGIGWGVLAGFVVSVAIELGYEVREIGGRYILFKTKMVEAKR